MNSGLMSFIIVLHEMYWKRPSHMHGDAFDEQKLHS